MKVAILHDYLNQFGGAERVLKTFVDIFPDADIYTLLYDEEKTNGWFKDKVKAVSFLDNSLIRKRHRAFIPLMPLASRLMDLKDDYDLIISSSAGYAKGFGNIATHKKVTHICYCHSPLRYAWEIDYLKDLPNAPQPLTSFIAEPIAKALRNWDLNASKNANAFIVNSAYIGSKVRSYYDRDFHIVHPPVDTNKFYLDNSVERGDYYLMVGRLLYYKMFHLGIEAFNRIGEPLKIVGAGPEYDQLRSLAKDNIEFIRDISDDELRSLYNGAKGFIFPQVEDFGLVAAEAQACGLPIIAYEAGGAKEIVEDNRTGLFFKEQNSYSLLDGVNRFERQRFNRDYITKRAQMFSEDNFKKNMTDILNKYGIRI